MPTTYTDQFFILDPYAPPPAGTTMVVHLMTLRDNNNDGDIDRFNNDRVDGLDVRSSYPGDTVTIDVPGVGYVTYTGVTFYLSDGREVFTPNDGQVLHQGTLVTTSWVSGQGPLDVADLGPVCFTRGTLIETAKGRRPVEGLRHGDLIATRDNGFQNLVSVSTSRFAARGGNAPVRIEAGAFGNSEPLLVSQQHRMLVSGWQAELYAGCDEVLVAAKHLVNGDTIRIVEGGEVEYFHLLMARHEIITAAGAPSESYFPAHAHMRETRSVIAEFRRLFPGFDASEIAGLALARPEIHGFEGQLLAA